MSDPISDHMKALAESLLADEAYIQHLGEMAEYLIEDGEVHAADACLKAARDYRVQTMLHEAQLGAFVEQYGELHKDT